MKTSLIQKLKLNTKTARQRLVLVAMCVGLAGAIVVLVSRAATNSVSLEAESATITGNATAINDASASGGRALHFGQAITTPTGSYTFPLKVSTNSHYLVDQNNKPFLVAADTAWPMMPSLSVADAKRLIDTRKSQGFNAILTNLVDWNRTDSGPNGVPFTGGDVTKPVESYWQTVDQKMAYAKTQGMILIVGPMPTGNNSGMDASAMATYGTWIGRRYKDQGNLLWYVGHDMSPSQDYAANNAEAAAIKTQIPGALITYHMYGLAYPWENNAPNESWYGFYGMQWNGVVAPYMYELVRNMYNRSPARPSFILEPAYEPNNADPNGRSSTTPLDVRNQVWWAVLAGAMGVSYGGPVTAWNIGDESAPVWSDVEREPAKQVGNVRKILEQFAWEKLVPAGGSSTQTAVASDGSLIVAYNGSGNSISVDLSKLSGAGSAQWFDPVSGLASGGAQPTPNSGSRTFATPGNNSGGDSDWVLVIKKT